MDRKTLLAIAICFLIFAGWQKFYLEPLQHRPGTHTAAQKQTPAQAPAAAAPTAIAAAPVAGSPQPELVSQTLQTGTGEARISNGNLFITEWELKNYRTGLSADSQSVSLTSVSRQAAGEGELGFDATELSYLAQVRGALTQAADGWVWSYEDANISLRREWSATPGQNYANLVLKARFKSKRPAHAFVSLSQRAVESDPEAQDRQLLYYSAKSVERVAASSSKLKDVAAETQWIGVSNRYFFSSIVADGAGAPRGLVQPLPSGVTRVSLVYPVSGDELSIPLRVYFGPKDLEVLRSVHPSLDHALDLGWFTLFAYPLLATLKWFYKYVGNYGIAIILLTLLVKLLTYPLTLKSMKSMKEMARLQPQLQKIRDKYKDDKEALNREMLTLMRSHGYNPVAGCLPMLIQMPVFFALYRVLYSSTELYHAPFALWIHDLSAKDPFYVTPVVLTLVMYLQQKMTPTTTADPAQQRMMQLMPLFFGVFMISVPAGLTIYMLVNSLSGIVQQLILNKKLGPMNAVPATVTRA